MEAKDTIMGEGKIKETIAQIVSFYIAFASGKKNISTTELIGRMNGFKTQLFEQQKAQAEISFKAGMEQGFKQIDGEGLIPKSFENGKKYGVKEVVELLGQPDCPCIDESTHPIYCIFTVGYDEWQTFLKSRGL